MSKSERYLDGIHAVVTGGSRGIGAAVGAALAARGAAVTLMAREPASLDRQVLVLRGGGATAEAVGCDVTSQASVEKAFVTASERLGPIGILVNNAGTAESATAEDTTRAMWDRMLAVNLTGTYLCSMQVLPAMLDAGRGRIVNVASTAGLRGYKTMTAYCAAKHGVIGYTRALALETAKRGITVNAVCPGYTDTELTDSAVANLVGALGKTPDEARAMLVRIIPRGVMTTPAEVAAAVAWLCAPDSGAITGVALPVAGGEVG
jgi:NAD(P)-dependent dehydrogenase (short-subunit alcohol dehydrogenase family)